MIESIILATFTYAIVLTLATQKKYSIFQNMVAFISRLSIGFGVCWISITSIVIGYIINSLDYLSYDERMAINYAYGIFIIGAMITSVIIIVLFEREVERYGFNTRTKS